jgi:biopolymer transport protein ExbD
MITRPLDLAARLAPPPRRMEYVFFVNLALIAVFFGFWGSPYILAPGLRFDFLPVAPGARAGAVPTTDYVTVLASGQIVTSEGLKTPAQLEEWLKHRPHSRSGVKPALLLQADRAVPMGALTGIISAADRAGFTTVMMAAEEH